MMAKSLPFDIRLAHRIRAREMDLVLREVIQHRARFRRILEIGAGDGFQSPHLGAIGKVFPFDVVRHSSDAPPRRFLMASAERMPYADRSFDLIYSSNVIEHIEQRQLAFEEMRRVSAEDALFLHVLPTHIWKLLSVAVYYPLKVVAVGRRILQKAHLAELPAESSAVVPQRSFMNHFLPRIHGTAPSHTKEFIEFRISSWERLFLENGFSCLRTIALLTYSPPEMPLFPPNQWLARAGLPSSVLFVLAKNHARDMAKAVT